MMEKNCMQKNIYLLFDKIFFIFRLNFRVQKNTRTQKGSDFAEVAYYVLKNRCNEDVTMSIWEINKILDEIAVENGKGKDGQKVYLVFNIF